MTASYSCAGWIHPSARSRDLHDCQLHRGLRRVARADEWCQHWHPLCAIGRAAAGGPVADSLTPPRVKDVTAPRRWVQEVLTDAAVHEVKLGHVPCRQSPLRYSASWQNFALLASRPLRRRAGCRGRRLLFRRSRPSPLLLAPRWSWPFSGRVWLLLPAHCARLVAHRQRRGRRSCARRQLPPRFA